MHFFSFVLSQISLNVQFNIISLNVQFNIQLVPSFIEVYPIIWAAMNKVFIHHSDPYFPYISALSILARTFPPTQQTRAPLCKGDVRLGPSTGCIAELSLTNLKTALHMFSLTNLKNCFTHVILFQL